MNNNLANPLLILKEKFQQAWSGCLEITEPEDSCVSWQIYLSQGKVQYATSTAGNQERLNYFWQQLNLDSNCPQVTAANEYEQICQWCDSNSASNATELLLELTQEALNQILSIEKTVIKTIENRVLSVPITSFSIKELLSQKFVDSCKEIRLYLKSPFARLNIKRDNSFKFYKLWKNLGQDPDFDDFINNQKISFILEKCSQDLAFYQFAALLGLDILSLAGYLQPFIEAQIVELKPFNANQTQDNTSRVITSAKYTANISPKNVVNASNKSSELINDSHPTIACIDDSKTVHKQVNLTLEAIGYKVINITDPSLALKSLSREQPILILMDINMPTMNGYDLCSMLRRSHKFSEVPIVMLTGRDGIIDRMRAKFVGSTDYLTKPFQPNTLIEMVQKFVPSPVSI